MSSLCRTSCLLVLALLAAGCERERRAFHDDSTGSAGISPTTFRAGGVPATIVNDARAANYEGNAFHVGEGKRYYEWYNCYSCHAAGGGDIGPPLMDEQWRYGGEFEQIRASITEGRPNGMPAFRGIIPDEQILQIVAYVRSMGGNVPKDVPPSRGDELYNGPAKTLTKPTPPRAVAPSPRP